MLDYRDVAADEALRSKVRWILIAAAVLAFVEMGTHLANFGVVLFPNMFGGWSSGLVQNGRVMWFPIALVFTSVLIWAGLLVCAVVQLRGRHVRRPLVYFAAAAIVWPLCITTYYQFREPSSPYGSCRRSGRSSTSSPTRSCRRWSSCFSTSGGPSDPDDPTVSSRIARRVRQTRNA